MIYLVYIIIYFFVFVLGAVIGSFLNVLIYRIPLKLSFAKGFSFCPKCEHRLYPKDLIPIISYLSVGRKCRYCGEPISSRYMIVEIITGLLFVLSYSAFMEPLAFLSTRYETLAPAGAVLYFIVLAILLVITFIDYDTMEIPDSLNIAILICGIVAIWIGPEISLLSRIIGFFAISVPLFIIALLIAGAFGGGDIKLMAAAGFFLGWQNAIVATFIGIIIGGIYGAILLAGRKKGRKEHFAFGPALCIGIAISMFFANDIIEWYLTFF